MQAIGHKLYVMINGIGLAITEGRQQPVIVQPGRAFSQADDGDD